MCSGEAKLNLAIDEIRAAESEKRESCIEIEKRKIDELEAALAQIRNVSWEMQVCFVNIMTDFSCVIFFYFSN